jgi:hypothetical protein
MVFSLDAYGIAAGIVMLLIAAFEYIKGPVGA